MAEWVLIVIINGSNGAATVDHVEFATQSHCMRAEKVINDKFNSLWTNKDVTTLCAPTGKTDDKVEK